MKLLILATLAALQLAATVHALTIQLMPTQKQCFFEHLKQGERMMVGFQVEKVRRLNLYAFARQSTL
jgi:hypothetical protein